LGCGPCGTGTGVVITIDGRCVAGALVGSGGGAAVGCGTADLVTVSGTDGGACTAGVVTVAGTVGTTVGTVVREICGDGGVVGGGPVGVGSGPVEVGNATVDVGVGVGNGTVDVGVGNGTVDVGVENGPVEVGNGPVEVGNGPVEVGNGLGTVVVTTWFDAGVVVVAAIGGTGKNVNGDDGFTGAGEPGGGGGASGLR
jgi:hypothetical protein